MAEPAKTVICGACGWVRPTIMLKCPHCFKDQHPKHCTCGTHAGCYVHNVKGKK